MESLAFVCQPRSHAADVARRTAWPLPTRLVLVQRLLRRRRAAIDCQAWPGPAPPVVRAIDRRAVAADATCTYSPPNYYTAEFLRIKSLNVCATLPINKFHLVFNGFITEILQVQILIIYLLSKLYFYLIGFYYLFFDIKSYRIYTLSIYAKKNVLFKW